MHSRNFFVNKIFWKKIIRKPQKTNFNLEPRLYMKNKRKLSFLVVKWDQKFCFFSGLSPGRFLWVTQRSFWLIQKIRTDNLWEMFSVVKVLFSIISEGLSFEMKKKKTDTRLKKFQTKQDWPNEFLYYPKSFCQSNPVIHLSPISPEGINVIYLYMYVCPDITIYITLNIEFTITRYTNIRYTRW